MDIIIQGFILNPEHVDNTKVNEYKKKGWYNRD